MSTIDELLGIAASRAVSVAADEAIAVELGSDVERLWDVFRAEFRGKDIRPAIREAATPLDMRAVLIAKLETIDARAEALIPVLKQTQAAARALILTLRHTAETPPDTTAKRQARPRARART